jgi:hypothetical protein
MSRNRTILKGGIIVFVSALLAYLTPSSALACAACFGQDSGPMAQGMNWGILSLLGVIVSVLITVAAFFVFLARRSVSHRTVAVSGATSPEHGRPSWEIQKPRPQTA